MRRNERSHRCAWLCVEPGDLDRRIFGEGRYICRQRKRLASNLRYEGGRTRSGVQLADSSGDQT